MENVVKLILVCQAKDDYIPQLMPLLWIGSVLIWIIFLLMLIHLYFYININVYVESDDKEIDLVLRW